MLSSKRTSSHSGQTLCSFPAVCGRKEVARMRKKAFQLFVCAVILLYIFCIKARWPLVWLTNGHHNLIMVRGSDCWTVSSWVYYTRAAPALSSDKAGVPFYLLCWYKPIRQSLRRFDGALSIGKGARWVLTLLLSVRICYSVQQTGICLISNYLLQFITASKRIPVHSRVLLLSPLW